MKLWQPDRATKAAIRRGDRAHRYYMKRMAAEHEAHRKRFKQDEDVTPKAALHDAA